MAIANDQGARRARTTSNGTSVSSVSSIPSGPSTSPPPPPRVTRLRARTAPVEVLEQLPLAVGFGSAIDLPPCRLWAVPGLPADVVSLPAELDDGWRPVGWHDGADVDGSGRTVAGGRAASIVAPSVGRPRTRALHEPAPVSLTVRGRAVLLLLAAAVGVVVVVFAWFGAASSNAPTRTAQPAQVTVHDGDTLWSIAGKVAPNRDPRAVVARLLQLNHLRTPTLVPGQVLLTR